MDKMPAIDTPQFRTMLVRKLGNIFPSCDVEWVDTKGKGVKFRLRDKTGQHRSNVVTIHRVRDDVLTASNLMAAVRCQGNPEGGLPKELGK